MLPIDIQKEVTALWDLVSAAGLASSPYVTLEQIACLIFLKRLDGMASDPHINGPRRPLQLLMLADEASGKQSRSYWAVLLEQEDPGSYLNDWVFPWLRSLEQRIEQYPELVELLSLNGILDDAYFQLDPTKSLALSRLLRSIDALFPSPKAQDKTSYSLGEVFEYLFSQGSNTSYIGPLVTARHITRFMVALLDPEPGQHIIDPAAGTAGLLVCAQQYMLAKMSRVKSWNRLQADMGRRLVGVDLSHALARIGWVNLLLHGIEQPRFMQGNSLASNDLQKSAEFLQDETYDLVLCDMPFGGRIDPEEAQATNYQPFYARDEQGNRSDRVELLFVWRALSLLRVGGSTALIVPQSLLVSRSKAQVELRRELLTNHCVEAVILLPGAIFHPYIGIKAAILVVRKVAAQATQALPATSKPQTDKVWFYEVTQDGYSMDQQRTELDDRADNDLFDALMHFRQRRKGTAAWEAGKDQYHCVEARHGLYWTSPIDVATREASQVRQWQVPVRLESSTSAVASGCIEPNDWSLDIGDYKVIEQPRPAADRSASQLLKELEDLEIDVLARLRQLRELIGDAQ